MSRSERSEGQAPLHIQPPTPRERLLLVALLGRPESAAPAWGQWTAGLSAAAWIEALTPYKRSWPLVLWSARRSRLPIPRPVSTALKAAYVAEKLRHEFMWSALEGCAAALRTAGISSVALGGAALAATVYPEPALRHVHAIRLGVSDVEGAGRVLGDCGFRRVHGARGGSTVCLVGKRGEALVLAAEPTGFVGVSMPSSQIRVSCALDALTSAWEETLAADAYPMVWAFDVFFVARSEGWTLESSKPMERVRRPLLDEAMRLLARALADHGAPA